MDNLLLIAVIMAATAATGWFYWQTQKTEQRIVEISARLAGQANLVGEMVDEIFAASQHLYYELDRWQSMVDDDLARTMPATPLSSPAPETDETVDAEEALSPPIAPVPPIEPALVSSSPQPQAPDQAGDAEPDGPSSGEYSPHLQALQMAREGVNPVEIARYTGIGTEELRLLLRFQEEINSPSTV